MKLITKHAQGSCTWLNGVYWGRIEAAKRGCVRFSNLDAIGKIGVEALEAEVESDVVYPLLRGRDVKRWGSDRTAYILVPQDPKQPSKGIAQPVFQNKFPKASGYFAKFKHQLESRSGYKKYLKPVGEPYYSLYNIGPYTFAPYKVVWKEQSSELQCAVVSSIDNKVIIPDHKLMLVPFESEIEAHFVCSLLNSSVSRFIVLSYAISTQQSTHILANINIPKYNSKNSIHQDLFRLSKLCHEKVAASIDVTDLEEQIDQLAAELWGLTKQELKDIKESLEELR